MENKNSPTAEQNNSTRDQKKPDQLLIQPDTTLVLLHTKGDFVIKCLSPTIVKTVCSCTRLRERESLIPYTLTPVCMYRHLQHDSPTWKKYTVWNPRKICEPLYMESCISTIFGTYMINSSRLSGWYVFQDKPAQIWYRVCYFPYRLLYMGSLWSRKHPVLIV